VPVRSHYEGLPLMAGRGEDEGGRKPAGKRRALGPLSSPGRTGLGTQNRRGGAPGGVLFPIAREEETPRKRLMGGRAGRQRVAQTLAFPGAPLPSLWRGDEKPGLRRDGNTGEPRARIKQQGRWRASRCEGLFEN
jgi:hypothetical protein